jgi:hypothetical protein
VSYESGVLETRVIQLEKMIQRLINKLESFDSTEWWDHSNARVTILAASKLIGAETYDDDFDDDDDEDNEND